jgi:phasin family protein
MTKSNATPTFDPAALFAGFKVPNVDVEALISAQRRNVEAFTAANKVAVDGVKELAARQAEFTRATVDAYVAATRELMGVKDVQTGVAKQVELTKTAFETSVSNLRELAEIANKTNTEAFEVLNKRFVEGLGEIQAITKVA